MSVLYQWMALVLMMTILTSCTSSEKAFETQGKISEKGEGSLYSGPPQWRRSQGHKKALGEKPKLRALDQTLITIRYRYYDPSRIKPSKMVTYAIDGLQSLIPELVAEFDKALEENPTQVTLRLHDKRKTLDLSQVTELEDIPNMASEIFDFLVPNLQEPQDAYDLEYTFINGMLETLDPHSSILSPDMYEDMQTSHGGFGGLGIVISIRDEELTVISPIEGTPAYRAGIKAGDRIVRIGEESTVNMPLYEAVDKLRGKEGTPVVIYIMRKGWSEPKPFKIIRARIQVRSLVHHALKDEHIAYIKIKAFERNTGEDLRTKLDQMKKEMGEIRGLILDLRDNPGGLLTQAISVADRFLDKGEIVISEEFGGRNRSVEMATREGSDMDYPIVVLTNAGSASASEIVSGALKNNGRALIIGDQTFGKGSVQILSMLDDGSALKLTIAQYLTPGDISIQGVGIMPDIRVIPATVFEDPDQKGVIEVDLFASEHIRRENSLEQVLHSNKIKKIQKPKEVIYYFKDLNKDDKDELRSEDTYREDFEIRLAKALILSTQSTRPQKMLKDARKTLKEIRGQEMEKISRHLEKYNIDWKTSLKIPSQPIEGRLEVVGKAQSGAWMTLRATVKNKGTQPIYRLYAVSESNNLLFDDREFLFGRLNAGEEKSWDFKVKIPDSTDARRDRIYLQFADQHGKLTEPHPYLDLTIEAPKGPHFAYTYQLIEGSGQGDGFLQVGEEITLRVWLQNNGSGSSGEGAVYLKNNSGKAIYLEKGRESFKNLKPGEIQKIDLNFQVREGDKEIDHLEVDLTVYDKDFGRGVTQSIQWPLLSKRSKGEKLNGLRSLKANTPVFGGAWKDAPIIAQNQSSAVVEEVWKNKDADRCEIAWRDQDKVVLHGWVHCQALTQEEIGNRLITSLKPKMHFTAPFISFQKPWLESNQDRVEVLGKIWDDGSVKNYYVYLWHKNGFKIQTQKLDYRDVNQAQKHFSIQVPLREGINRLTIVAKDDLGLEETAFYYIHKPETQIAHQP